MNGAEGAAKVVDDDVEGRRAGKKREGEIGTTLMGHSNIKLYGAPMGTQTNHSQPKQQYMKKKVLM